MSIRTRLSGEPILFLGGIMVSADVGSVEAPDFTAVIEPAETGADRTLSISISAVPTGATAFSGIFGARRFLSEGESRELLHFRIAPAATGTFDVPITSEAWVPGERPVLRLYSEDSEGRRGPMKSASPAEVRPPAALDPANWSVTFNATSKKLDVAIATLPADLWGGYTAADFRAVVMPGGLEYRIPAAVGTTQIASPAAGDYTLHLTTIGTRNGQETSGGTSQEAFTVPVEGAPTTLAPLATGDWELIMVADPTNPYGDGRKPPVIGMRLLNPVIGAPGGVADGYLLTSSLESVSGTNPNDPLGGWPHLWIPHPDQTNYPNVWLQRNVSGLWKDWLDRTDQIALAETDPKRTEYFWACYSPDDPATVSREAAQFSPASADRKSILLHTPQDPAGPSEVKATVATGSADGEIVITWADPVVTTWGDATVAGDGAATAGSLWYDIGAGWVDRGSTAPGSLTVQTSKPGQQITVSLKAISSAGRESVVTTLTATAAGTAPVVQSVWRLADPRNKDEWDQGSPRGSQEQWCQGVAWSLSNTNVVYMMQDVANVWRSDDTGKSWKVCQSKGLHATKCGGIAVDPTDENRVIVVGHSRGWEIESDYVGFYLSEDGGATWSLRHKLAHAGEIWRFMQNITHVPSTVANGKLNTHWYAAISPTIDKTLATSESQIPHGIYRSTDGGRSWTNLGGLPSATYGDKIVFLVANPANASQLYLSGDKGLFRVTVSGNTFSSSKISGTGGLPAKASGSFEISAANSNHMSVAVIGDGIFASTDGGASWSRKSTGSTTGHAVHRTDRTRAFMMITNSRGLYTHNFNAASPDWLSPTWTTKPGENPNGNWQNSVGYHRQGHVMFHPTNSNIVHGHGGARNKHSENGAKHWNSAHAGYSGYNYGFGLMEQMWDIARHDRWYMPHADVGLLKTENKGLWYSKHPTASGSDKCIAIAQQPISKSGGTEPRILVMIGLNNRYNKGKVVLSTDGGASWTDVITSEDKYYFMAYAWQDASIAYTARLKSTNGGSSWSTMTALDATAHVVGVSRTDSDVLYAQDIDEQGRNIWMSSNGGSSWTLIQTLSYTAIPQGGRQAIFRVHPTDPYHVIIAGSARRQPARLRRVNGSWTLTQMDAFQAVPTIDLSNNTIARVCFDPRDGNIIYALMGKPGSARMFRTVDGGARWTDVSADMPLAICRGLEVSPHTGDVFISGDNGTRVLAPPYQQTSPATIWSTCDPNNVWTGTAA